MENASKALIIAGAILLSILIISLGIVIYNQASSVIDNDAMDAVEVQSFNGKFEKYLGTNVRGANVNALITTVKANNNSAEDESRKITLAGDITLEGQKTKAETGKTYNVTVDEETGYTSAGLISVITIEERK